MARKIAKTKKNQLAFLSGGYMPFLLSIVFFFAVCVCSASAIRVSALVLIILTLGVMLLRYPVLRERVNLPLVALGLFVLMAFISTLYAPSGKFALNEFLKLITSFCLALLLVCLAPAGGSGPARWAATILEGAVALICLVSIDLISTRFISTPVLSLLRAVTGDYTNVVGLEDGIRITSMIDTPNVFAGAAGLGVLLSLSLCVGAQCGRERKAHLCCLFVSSLAFVLAFSMGASASIAAAFVAYLALEKKERRGALLVVMVETLVLAVAGAALVSMTAFDAWDGVQPVPLLCAAAGAALMCLADRFVNSRVTERLASRGRLVVILICVVLVLVLIFALAALLLTGGTTLAAGESLRRSAYPEPGGYTLEVSADPGITVTVESQNQQETMMHTSTVIYSGPLEGAQFTVPEGSLVVYFNFYAPEGGSLNEVGFTGGAGSGSVPLGYKLLPGFIANRLQGLLANQNAIQRTVFFSDGLKFWQRAPVFGLGLGAFENGIKGVQSFYYETRYAHNHYIQALAELGVVGLVLFVGLFAVSAAAVLIARRREGASPLLPALGAALVFMAIHAFTEVVFSVYLYLPFAFGVFALVGLCCPDAFPWPRAKKSGNAERLGITIGFAAVLVSFGVLLALNVSAANLVKREPTLNSVEQAAKIDKYEWADYALSYVISIAQVDGEVDPVTRQKTDEFARRLAEVNSNTIPIYLADYYFGAGREQAAISMLIKYVDYVSSDPSAWEESFAILAQYESGTEVFSAGVAELARMLDAWNAENMGSITLSESAAAFAAKYAG